VCPTRPGVAEADVQSVLAVSFNAHLHVRVLRDVHDGHDHGICIVLFVITRYHTCVTQTGHIRWQHTVLQWGGR
jgi:hypothetical protein